MDLPTFPFNQIMKREFGWSADQLWDTLLSVNDAIIQPTTNDYTI